MNVSSFLAILGFCVNLFLGAYVFIVDHKSNINRIFFLMAVCMSAWCLAGVFAYSADSLEDFIFSYKAASIFFMPFYPITLLFIIELTAFKRLNTLRFIVLFAPAVFILLRILVAPHELQVFVRVGNRYALSYPADSYLVYVYFAYAYGCTISGLVILFLQRKRIESERIRKQINIIIASFFVTLVIGTLEALIIPIFTDYVFYGSAPIIVLIWTSGIAYVIVRYRFLAITPAFIADTLVSNIDEMVILFDRQYRIIMLNRKAESVLGLKDDLARNMHIRDIIADGDVITCEVGRMMGGEFSSFSCRINVIKGSDPIRIDARLSIALDKFRDIIGILLIGWDVVELRRLRSMFQITEREEEIIHFILSGSSNREISGALGITERTVKAHITNIHQKLSVTNKIQLSNLLQMYGMLPRRHSADRVIHQLQKK